MEPAITIYSPPSMNAAEIAAQVAKRLERDMKRHYESPVDRLIRRILG